MPGPTFSDVGELVDVAMADRALRLAVVAYWRWLGWHYLVGPTIADRGATWPQEQHPCGQVEPARLVRRRVRSSRSAAGRSELAEDGHRPGRR
ncbi:DUF6186 family protein [Mumia qirimensis]|uniref:DUF6186 family protein n=1 Tax=Mumia qirimensis TaxID=3234852 RepID=UPI00351D885E